MVGTVLDVGAQLLLHVLLDVRTMKKLSGKRTKVGQEFHNSSGSTVRAVCATRSFGFAQISAAGSHPIAPISGALGTPAPALPLLRDRSRLQHASNSLLAQQHKRINRE